MNKDGFSSLNSFFSNFIKIIKCFEFHKSEVVHEITLRTQSLIVEIIDSSINSALVKLNAQKNQRTAPPSKQWTQLLQWRH